MNDMTDYDALLDGSLEDLEDLPEFKPFPAGAHLANVTAEIADIGEPKKKAVKFSFTCLETIELADPNTPEVDQMKPGDSDSITFFLDNEFGRGRLKLMLAKFKNGLGLEGTGIREIVEQIVDIECSIITKQRQDKKDKTRFYTDVKDVVFG